MNILLFDWIPPLLSPQENCYSQLYQGLKTTYSLLSSTQVNSEFDLTNLLYDLEEFISNIEEEASLEYRVVIFILYTCTKHDI